MIEIYELVRETIDYFYFNKKELQIRYTDWRFL